MSEIVPKIISTSVSECAIIEAKEKIFRVPELEKWLVLDWTLGDYYIFASTELMILMLSNSNVRLP